VLATRFAPVRATGSFFCDGIGFPLCNIGAGVLGALDDGNDFRIRPAGESAYFHRPGDGSVSDPTPEGRDADLQDLGAFAYGEERVCELHLLHLGFD